MSTTAAYLQKIRDELHKQRLAIMDEEPGPRRRVAQLSADISEPMLLHLAEKRANGDILALGQAVMEIQMALHTAMMAYAFAASDGDPGQTAALLRIVASGITQTSSIAETMDLSKINVVKVHADE